MPESYVKMRDKFRKTMGDKAAKRKAARIYNAKRGKRKPVTRGYD